MGHTLSGVDNHYFPGKGTDITDDVVEAHRKVYAEKALPSLRLEAPTAGEADQVIQEQRQEIDMLKEEMKRLQIWHDAEKEDLETRMKEVLATAMAKFKEDLFAGKIEGAARAPRAQVTEELSL